MDGVPPLPAIARILLRDFDRVQRYYGSSSMHGEHDFEYPVGTVARDREIRGIVQRRYFGIESGFSTRRVHDQFECQDSRATKPRSVSSLPFESSELRWDTTTRASNKLAKVRDDGIPSVWDRRAAGYLENFRRGSTNPRFACYELLSEFCLRINARCTCRAGIWVA